MGLRLNGVVLRREGFELCADWCIETGTHATVIGPSGAGKSTLLSIIAGFDVPESGTVEWNGQPMPDDPGARPVSMLFQDHNLFPHLTLAQNVGLGLEPTLAAAQREEVGRALEDVGLAELASRKPGQVSGGQQSRAALARVAVQANPIMLLDEPFAALGPGLRIEMLELVRAVAVRIGATLLMVTHDPEDARRLGGEAIFVEGGTAHPPVPVGRLFSDPPATLRDYLG